MRQETKFSSEDEEQIEIEHTGLYTATDCEYERENRAIRNDCQKGQGGEKQNTDRANDPIQCHRESTVVQLLATGFRYSTTKERQKEKE